MSNSVAKVSLEPIDFVRQSKRILKEIVETKNFDAGCDFIVKMGEMGEAFNRATEIMLSGMDKAWKPDENGGETFMQFIVRKTSLSPETIVRNTRNHSLSAKIPGEFRETIDLAPQNCRIQIANLIEDGYELEHKDWLALSEVAGDRRRVGQIARKIKGVAPRTNWSMFVIDEKGFLWAVTKENREIIGELYVFSDSEFVLDRVEKAKRLLDAKPSIEY